MTTHNMDVIQVGAFFFSPKKVNNPPKEFHFIITFGPVKDTKLIYHEGNCTLVPCFALLVAV